MRNFQTPIRLLRCFFEKAKGNPFGKHHFPSLQAYHFGKWATGRVALAVVFTVGFLSLFCLEGAAQCKDYILNAQGDTLNCVDMEGKRQGRWVIRVETVRGEPGFEEEGIYLNGKKEGLWRIYSLMGDPIGMETYKWGNKDGTCLYYNIQGELIREESWKAFNPAKTKDTLVVEDVDKPGTYVQKIITHEGAAVKHGEWRLYEPGSGRITKREVFVLGVPEGQAVGENLTTKSANTKGNGAGEEEKEKKPIAKPKEVAEFEKKNSGKKKTVVRDGRTGG